MKKLMAVILGCLITTSVYAASITTYTNETDPADGDWLYLVKDPGGSGTSRKVTVGNLIKNKQDTMGADDNYVTNAEKTVIGNTSGTNTGDNTIATAGDSATAFFSAGTLEDARIASTIARDSELHAAATLNASATTGGMSLSGQEISNRAATNAQTGYATAAQISAIEANDTDTKIVDRIKDETITWTGNHTFSGTTTIGDIDSEDWVTVAMMANGDHGAFTYTSNVAALDANTVDSDQYVDGSIDEPHLNTTNAPTTGYALTSASGGNDFTWVELTGGAETNSLETTVTGIADKEIFIGDGSNSGSFTTVSGDATLSNAGAMTVNNMQVDGTPGSSGTYKGFIISGVNAGETITAGQIVYMDGTSNEWMLADADAAGEFPALGMAAEGGTDGNAMDVLVRGIARLDTWSWTNEGVKLYLGDTAGGMTETAPSTDGDCVQVLATVLAITNDTILFNADSTWFLDDGS